MKQIKRDTETRMKLKMAEIDNENCLNVIVTSYFLQLGWLYLKVWEGFFRDNFSDVINSCKISLSSINPIIVNEIGTKMSEVQLENMIERKDKFISNVYKARIDQRIICKSTENLQQQENHLFWCEICKRLMTKEQSLKISCVK